jgi:hypothetical protein
MWRIAIVAMAVACSACGPEPVPITTASPPVEVGPAPVAPLQEAPAQPDCRPFSAPVMVGDIEQQTNGQVCHEPDGSWRVVQQTPGLPIQEYHLPPEGQQPPGAVASPAASQTGCQEHTIPLTVGGRAEQAILEACPQSDGSWRITQYTPGLPPQTYPMPPPPAMPPPPPPSDEVYGSGYPDYDESFDFDPYWVDAPWFYGLGPTLVVVYGFNHFHHGYAGGSRGRGNSTYPVNGASGESGSGSQRSGGGGLQRSGGFGGGGWGGGGGWSSGGDWGGGSSGGGWGSGGGGSNGGGGSEGGGSNGGGWGSGGGGGGWSGGGSGGAGGDGGSGGPWGGGGRGFGRGRR